MLPVWALDSKHAWDSQDKILICPFNTIELYYMPILSWDRNGTGLAWAPVPVLKIRTLQPT
jgi:hypothetical protein